MSGGEWLIRQFGPDGQIITERVTVEADGDKTVPYWWVCGPVAPAITFKWPNGRESYYPWTSILSAEYRPHPEP